MVSMKIVDLKINIDGLLIGDNETVDDFINRIELINNSNYPITYEILHEEEYE